MDKWLYLISNIEHDVEGFVASSIVDLDSGMALASKVAVPGFDLDLAGAYHSESVKFNRKIAGALTGRNGVDELLLTFDSQVHMVKMVESSVFILVVARRDFTTASSLRRTVQRHVV